MAAEYEVKEIGYIGSIWGGTFGQPKIVGRTIQVINVPNTIENGGWAPSAVYFTNKDDIDLTVFNQQMPVFPDGRKVYGIGKPNNRELNEISRISKVSTDYLSSLNVVYFRNPRGSDDLIPIQDENNWGSFEIISDTSAVYILSNDVKYLTKYVFLVSEEDLNLLKQYFLTIQSQETIFDPPVVADPTTFLLERKAPAPVSPQNNIDFTKINYGGLNPKFFNDRIIETIKTVEFKKQDYYNDIHEDMKDAVADAEAAEQFIIMITNAPEQFYISPREGDDEYERLSQAIADAIKTIETRYVGGGETGGEFPVITDDVTYVSDDGSITLDGGIL